MMGGSFLVSKGTKRKYQENHPFIIYILRVFKMPTRVYICLPSKSTLGLHSFIGGNLVNWRSNKLGVTAKFSEKTEYRAISHICWLYVLDDSDARIHLCHGIHHKWANEIYCDNENPFSSNPGILKRLKHIEGNCHFSTIRWKTSQEFLSPFW